VKDEVFSQQQQQLEKLPEQIPPQVAQQLAPISSVLTTEDAALDKYRISVRKNDFIVWLSLSAVQLELYQRFL
jgi:hypothetical protein